jgi:hypothetical protein
VPVNVAVEGAERLGEGALDHIDAVHDGVTLGDAAAARTVDADGMYLVEIGHSAVFLGEIGNLTDRRDVAVHRIDRFEGDQLRPDAHRLASKQRACATMPWILSAKLPPKRSHQCFSNSGAGRNASAGATAAMSCTFQ